MKKSGLNNLVIANMAQMHAYTKGAEMRKMASRFENFENLDTIMTTAKTGALTPMSLAQSLNANKALKMSLPASTQAHINSGNLGLAVADLAQQANGGGPINLTQPALNGAGRAMGGPWNSKLPAQATVLLNIGAPMVTAEGTNQAPPDAGQYSLPLFGVMASKSVYAFGGILTAPVNGYTGYAINGAMLYNNGGALPAPFSGVAVNPATWYIIYVKITNGSYQGVLWTINTSQAKIPYTMYLDSIYATYFTVGRFRYILSNSNQTEQYNMGFEVLSFGGWGKGGYNTVDPPMFKSPEQNQSGIVDVETPVDIGPEQVVTVNSDPTVITAGFSFGLFATNVARRDSASQANS